MITIGIDGGDTGWAISGESLEANCQPTPFTRAKPPPG